MEYMCYTEHSSIAMRFISACGNNVLFSIIHAFEEITIKVRVVRSLVFSNVQNG